MKDDSLGLDHMNRVGPGSPLTLDEWRLHYGRIKGFATAMESEIRRVAQRITEDAGLDPNLLGIHPNNAMCGLEYGKPWPDVDYNRVQVVLDLLRMMHAGHEVAEKFDDVIRGEPHQRWLDRNSPGDRLISVDEFNATVARSKIKP